MGNQATKISDIKEKRLMCSKNVRSRVWYHEDIGFVVMRHDIVSGMRIIQQSAQEGDSDPPVILFVSSNFLDGGSVHDIRSLTTEFSELTATKEGKKKTDKVQEEYKKGEVLAKLTISTKYNGGFEYNLRMNKGDVLVPCHFSKVSDKAAGSWSVELGEHEVKDGAVFYNVVAKVEDVESGFKEFKTVRRFQDFYDLYVIIHTHYYGHHLYASFPNFPDRRMKLFNDHLSETFVKERKEKLQNYMSILSKVPGVQGNIDLIRFLTTQEF